MFVNEWVAGMAYVAGAYFFFAGTVGLLRLPDVYTRLHASTKADNLGMGLVTLGLALQSWSWSVALKLLVIWVLVIFASTTTCHLIARTALRLGVHPWTRP